MTLQERNNTDDNTMNCSQYFCDSKLNDDESCPFSCYIICPKICKTFSYDDDVESPPPPPPRSITTNLVIMAGVLAGAFLLGVCWILVLNFYSKWKSSRRVNSPILDDAHEDFHDGNHGPEVEHHIWYINTVGLQQSVIDSITVCKFKKDEGLIEGVECSVCLSEFQEDETLRLLPKCSHAFHLPCIDTWLRSHKNCPMCRAAIVNEYVSSVFNATGANLDDLDSREDTQVENMENHGGMGIHEVGDSGTNEVRSRTEDFDATPIQIGRISEILNKSTPYFEARNCEVRVQSDLAKNRGVPEQEIQPMKRSVSLDSSSASVIHRAMANVAKHEGSSYSQLVRVKNPNSGIVAKLDGSGSSSIYKLMKSSSTGRSLQKKPISMKRSFSSSGKLSVHKQSRSQTSILPF